jgi:thioredoxin-dependent peroxiredoxin
MLKIGDKAPDFELKDSERNLIKLSDFKGKEIVLYFYPKDNTPGCTAEACSFRDNFLTYTNKEVMILGISADSVERHKKFAEKYKLPFPLLSDEGAKVCKKYGVWGKKNFAGKEYDGIFRTTFLIDKTGKIKEILSEIKCETHAEDVLKKI